MNAQPAQSPYWTAHDEPERQPAYGMWLCHCDRCVLVLRAEVALRPTTPFVLKTNFDRIRTTAELLRESINHTGSLDSLLYVNGDWIREVFVAPAALPAAARWCSLSEEEYFRERGLTAPVHATPVREPPARRRERERAARARWRASHT